MVGCYLIQRVSLRGSEDLTVEFIGRMELGALPMVGDHLADHKNNTLGSVESVRHVLGAAMHPRIGGHMTTWVHVRLNWIWESSLGDYTDLVEQRTAIGWKLENVSLDEDASTE